MRRTFFCWWMIKSPRAEPSSTNASFLLIRMRARKSFWQISRPLANASVGHLVFGIQEDGGLPVAVAGISCDDPDGEILRLENLVRDGIDRSTPRRSSKSNSIVGGHLCFCHPGSSKLVQTSCRQLQKPLEIILRNSAGKYPLDVSEVRSAVLQSGTLVEKIKFFPRRAIRSYCLRTDARAAHGRRTDCPSFGSVRGF